MLAVACNPTKRVPEGEHLLRRIRLVLGAKSADKDALRAIIKQSPNQKILGQRFYLHLYNLPDPERLEAAAARKRARTDARNVQRQERGRKPKPYRRTFSEWLRTSVGEPPVLIEDAETQRSVQQLALYMQKEGWFRATVEDTVHYRHRRLRLLHRDADSTLRMVAFDRGRPFAQPKVDVEYRVHPGPMYRLRHIRFTVDDPSIEAHVEAIRAIPC